MDKNNNRLNDLFNQAKNEPSKISYEETKKQFLKSAASINNAGQGVKFANFLNFKTIIMTSIITTITIGTLLFFNINTTKDVTEKKQKALPFLNEQQDVNFVTAENEYEEVVKSHLKKVELLPADLKGIYEVKLELASKLKETSPKDSLKRYKLELEKSARNNSILDTSYRFPSLNYEEKKANEKQKVKMLKQFIKFDKKKYAFIPSGNVKKNDKDVTVNAFYIQTTEVTNLEYRTFIFDLLIQGKFDEFLIAKPNQARWVKDYPYAYNKPMEENYFSHAAYDYYPVVGISRDAAEMYCKWLSIEANKQDGGAVPINDMRIPTDYEWIHAAKGGLDNPAYPWGGAYLKNSKACYLANYMPKKGQYSLDGAFHTAKVDSYIPNGYGLFCMAGNVAEMVYYFDENMMPGTKGGSWTSKGQELQVLDGKDRFKNMEEASVDVGFRPVISYLGKSSYYIPDMTVVPPGTVKIDPNFYADKTEITNFMWQEYVFWNKKTYGKDSKEYKNSLSDTTVWMNKLIYNEPYVKHYHTHPAYRRYPVVGITYEQAIDFCKWRTDRVKELYIIRKEGGDKKNIYPTYFEYRLPTKKEWERIARAGYSEKTQKKLDGKYKGQSTTNLKRGKGDIMGVAESLNDNADVTAPVDAYWPNKYGIYNIIGNVSEMISEKGIAKGGSWIDKEEEGLAIQKDYAYKEQNCWTGFRCVLEIKK